MFKIEDNKLDKKAMIFKILSGTAIVTLGSTTIAATKKFVTEKVKYTEKKYELEMLKQELKKLEEFITWEIDYMEDKMNLNMIQVKAEDIARFGDKPFAEAKEYTREYISDEILCNIRKRVEALDKVLNGKSLIDKDEKGGKYGIKYKI
jgi:hypothetical protein